MRFRLAPNPFGNTFGLFCSSRVHPALLGNVSRTFRFPRGQPDTHGRDYLLLKNHPDYARQPAQDFVEAYSTDFQACGVSIGVFVAFESRFRGTDKKKRPGANALGLNRYVCLKTRLDYFLKVTDTSASS